MMNKYELLHELIHLVENFDKQYGGKTPMNIEGFMQFAQLQKALPASTKDDVYAIKSSRLKGGNKSMESIAGNALDIDRVIAQFVIFMYRYAKFHSKKALQDTAFKTLDEFTYMATLYQFETLTKTTLVKKSIQEKASGIDTINRLILKKMIRQQNDKSDARQQILSITVLGKKEFFKAVKKMTAITHLLTGNLNADEKKQLAFLLKKLDDFHYALFLKGNLS